MARKFIVKFGQSKRTLNHAKLIEPKRENVYVELNDYTKALIEMHKNQKNAVVYGYVLNDSRGRNYLHVDELPTEKYQRLLNYVTGKSTDERTLYPYRGKGVDAAARSQAASGFYQILHTAKNGYISEQGLKKIKSAQMMNVYDDDIKMLEDIIERNFILFPFTEKPANGMILFDGNISYRVCTSFEDKSSPDAYTRPNLVFNSDLCCWDFIKPKYKARCIKIDGPEEIETYKNGLSAIDAIRVYEQVNNDLSYHTREVVKTAKECGVKVFKHHYDWNLLDTFCVSVHEEPSKYFVKILDDDEEYYALPNNQENWNMFHSLWVLEQKKTAAVKAVKTATQAVSLIRREE